MKTIVFIGSNKSGSSYEAIKAADSMQYYTVLLTDRRSFVDKTEGFQYVHSIRYCNLNNIDEIRNIIDLYGYNFATAVKCPEIWTHSLL